MKRHPADHKRHHEKHRLLVARRVFRRRLPGNKERGRGGKNRQDVRAVFRCQTFNPEETRVERVITEPLNRIVHRDKERHLYEQRQASRHGGRIMLFVQTPHFLPHHGRVISVLLLDFLDLRLYCLHRFHGTDLFHREGKQQRLNEYRQNDDSDDVIGKSETGSKFITNLQADAHQIGNHAYNSREYGNLELRSASAKAKIHNFSLYGLYFSRLNVPAF